MPYLNTLVMDNGLGYVTANGTRMDICTQEPTNYTEATATYTKGNKTSLTAGAPQAGTGLGRKVVVPAVTGGTITGAGTVSHWAYSSGSVLITAGPLASTAAVTSGSFTLTAIDISINAPT